MVAQAVLSALADDVFAAFLPKAVEENEQTSGGLIVDHAIDAGATSAKVGGQIELMSGALTEFQEGPTG